jgi:hypothetical protein
MRPTRIIPLCLLLLGLALIARAHAAPDAAFYDASMQHAVTVAPLQVVTAPAAAPVEVPIQEAVALTLTLFAFCLRRFSPHVAWLHTGTGLALISALTMILTAVAGAIAHQGVGVRVVLVALTSAMTAALAQANTSPEGTGALAVPPPLPDADVTARQSIDGASVRSLLPLLFVASLLVGGCAAQLRRAVAAHNVADQHAATTIKDAVKDARACMPGAAPCVEAALKVIEQQAGAVPAVMP